MRIGHRRELAWALLLLLVALLGPFYSPGGEHSGTDTWSVRPYGKKVLWALAARLFGDVERHTGRLLPPDEAGTLWILGPARYPDAAEWQRLHTWVAAGHTLVFAARQADPVVSLTPFGLRIRPGSSTALELDNALQPSPSAKRINWTGVARIEGARSDAWVPVRAGGQPVVVFQKEGQGVVVAAASDELFENAWVVNRQRGPLTVRLLEHARRDSAPVFVDESLEASGPPRVFGLLFSPWVRPVTLQVLAVLVLVGWAGSRGFGPPIGPVRAARRQISEHAVALGRLHYDVGTAGTLVGAYLDYVRHEWGLGRAAVAGADPASSLAKRAHMDSARVKALLGRAGRAAATERTPRAEAAAVIQGLADVKRRVPASRARV